MANVRFRRFLGVFALLMAALPVMAQRTGPTEAFASPEKPPVVEKTVLGRVAILRSNATIRSAPSENASVVYRVTRGQSLVVRPYSGQWMEVLLSNLRYGFVSARRVHVLNYEYLVDTAALPKIRKVPLSAVASYAITMKGQKAHPTELVRGLYGRAGLDLPRNLRQQLDIGKPVKTLSDLKPGDRLYFLDRGLVKLSEVGIYYGNGYFIHVDKGGVTSDYLGGDPWLERLVAARR